MKRRIVASLMVVSVTGLLASCGGGDSSDDTSSAAEDTTSATTTTEATALFECEDATGKPDATVAAIPTTGGLEYGWNQETLKFKPGEEVILEIANKSDTAHDFNADACVAGRFEKGESLLISFIAPDAPVEFVCLIHAQTMIGTIEPK